MPAPLPADSSVLAALGIGGGGGAGDGSVPLPSGSPGDGSGATPVPAPAQPGQPPASGIDLSGIIGSAQNSLSAASAQMASDFGQVNDISAQLVKNAEAQGADNIAIQTQQAQGLLRAQDAARSVAASYGGNPDDVSFIMNQLGAQWKQSESDRQDALNEVQKRQNTSFLDNPIQWLSDKMSINKYIDQYNDDEERSNSLYDQMSKINQLNTSTAEAQRAIAQTQTAATVAATTDLAAQKAAEAAQTARLNGVLYNVKGIEATTQMTQDQVDNAVKGVQTAIAQGHLAVAQQQVAIMEQERTQQAAMYAQNVKDKQEADAADAAVADQTNRGRATMGLPPVPAAKIFSMFKMGGEAGEALKQQYTVGALSDATGKPIIASNSGTAARVLATSNSPIATVNPAVKPVTDMLQGAYNTARNPQNAQMMGVNLKDPASLDSATSGVVQGQVAQMGANIRIGDASNIFQAPPLAALATTAAVKSNPLYNAVLEPQVKAGMNEVNPDKILSLTIDAVNNGQISFKDAVAGYSSLFNSAVTMNNATKDYTRFGIAPQATYNANIAFDGTFGGVAKVDLTNKAQVATMFMKVMANQSKIQSLQMGGGE